MSTPLTTWLGSLARATGLWTTAADPKLMPTSPKPHNRQAHKAGTGQHKASAHPATPAGPNGTAPPPRKPHGNTGGDVGIAADTTSTNLYGDAVAELPDERATQANGAGAGPMSATAQTPAHTSAPFTTETPTAAIHQRVSVWIGGRYLQTPPDDGYSLFGTVEHMPASTN